MNILSNFKTWSTRAKNASAALLFLGAYTISMVAPFVPTAHAATNDLSVSTHEGQLSPSLTYTSGNVTTYKEGDTIKFHFTVSADAAASGKMSVNFSDYDGNCHFFANYFVLGAVTNVSGVSPAVTVDGVPTSSGAEWKQVLNVTAPAAGSAVVNYTLKLSQEAGECNGSSQHSRLNNVSGDFKNIGQQNVPVPADKIIELPEIVVEKWVDTDGNGTVDRRATAGEWSFSLDGGSAVATDANGKVTFTNVTPDGNHTITEKNGPSDQSFLSGSGTSCKFYADVATATVASGQTATDALCVFNNSVQKGKLTLVKNLIKDNGGTASATDWTLSASGPTPISGVTGSAAVTNANVSAGTYTLSESGGPSGYTASEWSCTGGVVYGNSITLSGNQNVTCTITNNDQPGTLIVNKVLVNDNGGTKTVQNFSYTVNGGAPVSFGANGSNSQTVNAGSYSVAETVASGYTTTYANSLNGYANCSNLMVPNGGTVTCTITNNDKPAQLTLVKNLIKDNGGTASATDWTLSASGPTPISGVTGSAAVTNANVSAGTYTLSESGGPSGYTASEWSCTGGYQSGASITLAEGQSATCTITNNDNSPYLQLIKTVTNDNGGTATSSSWTLIATGSSPSTSFQGTSGVDSTSVNNFLAGTYTLSESGGPSGYTAGGWTCTGATAINNVIELVLGQSAVCTINNNDTAPKLTLNKIVVNDNGGTAHESDWTLTANGGDAGTLSGQGAAGNADVVSSATFKAGKYTLSESGGPSGYTASAWSCTGGKTPNAYNEITMNLGDEVTCTITNDDKQPTLQLEKKVINQYGGSAVAADWTLTATNTNLNANPHSISGAGGVTSGASFDAGTYTLSESPTNMYGDATKNYTASGWTCNGYELEGNIVHVALGQSVVCEITNSDKPGSVVGEKYIVNADGSLADDQSAAENWTIKLYSGTQNGDAIDWTYITSTTTAADGTYSFADLKAGLYKVVEVLKSGWTQIFGGGNIFTVGMGETYGGNQYEDNTNFGNFKNGSIGGYKFEDANQNSEWDEGEPTLEGWTIELYNGNGYDSEDSEPIATTETSENGGYAFTNLQPGSYVVCEVMTQAQAISWVQTYPNTEEDGCYRVTIDQSGEMNDNLDFGNFQRGEINGHKWNDVNGNAKHDEGEALLAGWEITLSDGQGHNWKTVTDENGAYSFKGLFVGQYTVCETMKAGWVQTYPVDATESECYKVNARTSGSVYTANFGNMQLAKLTIVKDVRPDSTKAFTFKTNLAEDELGNDLSFSMTDDGSNLGTNMKKFENVAPGTYTVTEDQLNGWKLDNIACTGTGVIMTRDGTKLTVTLAAGAVATCTFVNSFIPQVLAETFTLADTGTSVVVTSLIAALTIGTALWVVLSRRKAVEWIR